MSRLEEELTRARKIPDFDTEIAILRAVLNGEVGTDAQRNALLRIIKQNMKQKRAVMPRICAHLGSQFIT